MRPILPMLALLAACDIHAGSGRRTVPLPQRNEDAASSVYQITAHAVIDTRGLQKILGDDYEVPDSVEKDWSGTSWVIAKSGGTSYVMTAGHVCESTGRYHTDAFGDFPMSVSYSVNSADGKTVQPALVWADDDGIDLCILSVEADLGRPLQLADSDPGYGDHVEYIGEPDGIWGGGIAPIYEGLFSGRGTIWGDGIECLAVSVPAKGGASGSPVLYGGRVIGVFTAGSANGFQGIGTAVPWDVVKKFSDRELGR